MKTLVILRGLPSSGKTSFAQMLVDFAFCNTEADTPACMFAADDYFEDLGHFDPKQLGKAHEQCRMNVSYAMTEEVPLIVVHNTNTQKWEFKDYITLAEVNGYRYFVASLFDGGKTDEELVDRSTHGVPLKTMRAMRKRFQHNWKDARCDG